MKRNPRWALMLCLALLVTVALAIAPTGASAKPHFETTYYFLGVSSPPGTFWTTGPNDEYFHVRDLGYVFAAVSTDRRLTGLTNLTLNGDYYWPQTDPTVHSEGYIWGSGETVVGTWSYPFSEANIQAWWLAQRDPEDPHWKPFVNAYFTPTKPAATWALSLTAWEPADQALPVTFQFTGRGVEGSVAGLRYTSCGEAPQADIVYNWIVYEEGSIR